MGWIDWTLIGFILVNVLVAMSGAIFKPGAWYEALAKPWWNPPNWVFPIAWTLFYALIAVSGWLAYEVAGGFSGAPWAFVAYFVQLAFNAGWSAVFFGMKRPDLALIEVAGLWLATFVNVVLFFMVDAGAGWILLPYLLWITFAANLNRAMWKLNPQESGRLLAPGRA